MRPKASDSRRSVQLRHVTLIGLSAALVLDAGCGGSGATSASTPLLSTARKNVGVTFTVRLPAAGTSSKARAPRYVSTGTQSIVVTVTPSAGGVSTSGTIGCSANTCSGVVGAPTGTDSVAVNLYDGPNGTGSVLSTGTTTINVQQNAANAAALTFNGVVATATLKLPTIYHEATMQAQPITATAYDASGATIIGSAPYANPITVALSDAAGSVTLTKTTLNSPADTATFNYNGATDTGISFTPQATGVTGSPQMLTPIDPQSLSSLALWLDAYSASTITQVSGNVTQWLDKSANAIPFKQTTATMQPIYVTGALNGMPVVRFASVHAVDGLTTGSVVETAIFSSSYTLFVVCNPTGSPLNVANEYNTMPFSIQGWHTGPEFEGNPTLDFIQYWNYYGGNEHSLPHPTGQIFSTTYYNVALNSPLEITAAVTSGGGNMSMAVDYGGKAPSTTTYPANITNYVGSTVDVGAGCASCAVGSFQYRFKGDVAEVVAYSRVLSSSEIALIEAYLNAKWGV